MPVTTTTNGRVTARWRRGDPARIGDLAAVRQHFHEARWSAWNLVRTLTSTAAFACLIAAAMLHRSAK